MRLGCFNQLKLFLALFYRKCRNTYYKNEFGGTSKENWRSIPARELANLVAEPGVFLFRTLQPPPVPVLPASSEDLEMNLGALSDLSFMVSASLDLRGKTLFRSGPR
jgi:hypothetical protein